MKLIQRDPPIYLLGPAHILPDPKESDDEGLVAVGGDFSPMRLVAAYRRGIFPWFTYRKIPYWFSPNPRMVLFPENLHLSSSLKRVIKSGKFDVKFDENFEGVITGCAQAKRRDKDKTWITREFIRAYSELFEMGYAHCVAVYYHQELVGGLYGVQVGEVFCGESMFSVMSNASKVALAALVGQQKIWDFMMIDCQVPSDHLKTMGACEMDREEFLSLLR